MTTKILLVGANGRLGKVIAQCVDKKQNCEIVCGVDKITGGCTFPVYNTFDEITESPDIIIDFSHPSTLTALLAFATQHNIPCVISTTGFSILQINEIEQGAKKIPIFFSANMSLGVCLMSELSKKAAMILGNDFDIEIIEKHHNQKIDAPSGTAIMLANEINSVSDNKYDYVYDRQNKREKRSNHEIGFSSLRGGTIVGEHDVVFAGLDEVLTISHCAYSKSIFATGSVNAALFLVGKNAGLYTMHDMLQD